MTRKQTEKNEKNVEKLNKIEYTANILTAIICTHFYLDVCVYGSVKRIIDNKHIQTKQNKTKLSESEYNQNNYEEKRGKTEMH